jgi:hypothetical protein
VRAEAEARAARPRLTTPRLATLSAISLLGFWWIGRGLPSIPWLASDSASYLEFSLVRPHGYALFLAAYRLFSEDLTYLPSVQLALYVGAVLLLAMAVGRRTGSFGAAAAVLVLALGLTDTTTFPYILSDSLYAAALTTAIACFVLYAEGSRLALLLLAGGGIGLAIAFRAVGLALLPGFVIAVLAGRRSRHGSVVLIGVSLLPVALLYCGAASSQWLHNGRFALGSWGGMDVLGKLPLLSRPALDPSYARLNAVIDQMQPAREKLARLNPLLEALAARQYYDYLRWHVIIPELERSWPAWRDADEYRRGHLAAELAKTYVTADPPGFVRLTAIDFAGLWAMPRLLTEGEHAAALAQIESVGELPFLTAFAETTEGKLDYYKIVPDPSDPANVILFRAIVAAFWGLSLGVVALAATRRGRIVLSTVPDVVLIILAVHAVYAATALMEGVYERYVMPSWPLLVTGPILALGLLFRSRAR